ncbi:FecR family protein [Nitrogeniibacter aestuarii]|uniref:FecR family protein n=1 Tax=Nitrogeniibacter aestuarii TaxID=2815343 RepID=UPI001D1163B5|nr:FecR family protein [Nitrogeniibacter aestuarii]
MTDLRRLPFLWLILLALCLTGCGPSLSKVVREAPGGGFVAVDAGSAPNIVSVTRNGAPLKVGVPLALQKGDIIETGDGGAVLRLENGEVVLAPRTRVRLGSIEVFFGKVFASVRGVFRAEDDTVAADVEGTQFMFESTPGRGMRVVVLEGVVRCSSKSAQWNPLRVVAGREMTLSRSDATHPHVNPASEADMAEIHRWVDRIRSAPRAGYCCAGGRISESLSNACRGHFYDSMSTAQRQCTPGWCCTNGKVSDSLRADCRGSFHTGQRDAIQACTEPTGWCCSNEKLSQTKRSQCRGQFFGDDAYAARRACTPPSNPPASTGTVREPIRVDPRTIELLQQKVWCCAGGVVRQLDKTSCTRLSGSAYPDEATARRRCVVIR